MGREVDDVTDDRIAELLGWPRGRENRDSSLMQRIRIIVAEAQAEQDGHIYRLREQIAHDTAQIERMRAALTAARNVVAVDRESFIQCSTAPDHPLDPDDQGIVDEYDALLRQIDRALETENGS